MQSKDLFEDLIKEKKKKRFTIKRWAVCRNERDYRNQDKMAVWLTPSCTVKVKKKKKKLSLCDFYTGGNL